MLLTIFQLRAGILTWNVITYRSLEFWLLRREEHDGWCGCTFRFQNRSFEVKALHLYALDFIEYSFIDEWLAQRSLRSFFTCWAIALKYVSMSTQSRPIQVSSPFLGSSWRVLASNKMIHIQGMIARVFYLSNEL